MGKQNGSTFRMVLLDLNPVCTLGLILLQPRGEIGREGLASCSGGLQFDFLFGRLNRTDPSTDRIRQYAKLLGKSVRQRDRG